MEEIKINPKMVTLGRQLRGLLQKQLAEEVQISSSALSKIENAVDFIWVESYLADKIANVLNLKTDFLQKPGDIYYPAMGYFRRKRSISKRQLDQTVGIMNIYIMMLDSFLDMVDIPDLNIIDWDVEVQGRPEHAALNLREYWGVPRGRIDRVTTIIENNGIPIIEYDFRSSHIDGFSIRTKKYGRPIIFVNSTFPPDRKRLTIVHELGHVLLHSSELSISSYRDIEEEAFAFASEFLVPRREFKATVGNDKVTVRKLGRLKEYWKVSMMSLIKRAETCGVINYNQARYLYQQMAPYRKVEPIQIPDIERPSLFGEIITTIEKDMEYEFSDFSKLIGLSTNEFEKLCQTFIDNTGRLRIARN